MNNLKFKRFFLLSGLVCLFNVANAPTMEAQILASPVFDVGNNLIGGIQKVVMTASKAIREEILPWKEHISKVQDFFKKASETVNVVIRNLKMTHDLIETEEKINRLFNRSIDQINTSENVLQKWKYQWILGQLYWESRNIFGAFDLAHTEGQGIMDDEGRIRIIQQTLKEARNVYAAMRATIRRANRATYKFQRQKRELEVFNRLFGKED
ncbi:MAG: hypothetical protein AB8G86_00415 [Saprospiraceae bacterium]